MRATLILAILLPPSPQEEESLQELIRLLEHDDFAVREKAQKDLIERGEAALPLLKRTLKDLEGRPERTETRIRAETAVREIELALRAREVYRDPRTITLDVRDAPLGEVLQEIARQAGISIDASTIDREARVTLKTESAPLLKVLDDLCRGAPERTYESTDEGGIRFRKDRHPGGPAFYQGPFRIRLVSLQVERITDFPDRRCSLTLALEADCERFLKPLRQYYLEVERVQDDQGAVLEKGKEGDGKPLGGQARVIVQAVAAGFPRPETPSPQEFSFRKLSPGARSISFEGTLRYAFPLDVREVTFENLRSGEVVEVADWRIRIEPQEVRSDRGEAKIRHVTIHFEPLKGSRGPSPLEIDPRLDRESLAGVDEEGEEHRGQLHPLMVGNLLIRAGGRALPGQETLRTLSYQAIFPTLRLKGLKKMRFRLVDPVLNKTVPFRFEGVELP